MKWLLKHFSLSVIIFSLCFNFTAQSLKKEILYTHYDPVEYNWPAQITAIAEDSLGIKYFGTSSGVLIYNGATWKKLKTPFTVWSLVSDDNGRIYLGGENEFGHLKHGEKGEVYYSSLMDLTDYESGLENQDFRNILCSDTIVIFASQKYYFNYNFSKNKILEKYLPLEKDQNTVESLFTVNGQNFISINGLGLYEITTNFKKINIKNTEYLENEFITSGAIINNEILFLSSKKNLFVIDNNYLRLNDSVKNLINIHSSPFITELNNNYIVYSSSGGIQFFDENFQLKNEVNDSPPTCHLLDYKGDLWVGSLNGVYKINLSDGLQIIDLGKANIEKIESILISERHVNIGSYTSCYNINLNELSFYKYGENYEYFDIIKDPINNDSYLLAGVAGVDYYKIGGKHEVVNSCAPYTLQKDFNDSSRIWISNFDGISSISFQSGKWVDNGYVSNFNKDVSRIRFFNNRLFFSGNSGVFELLNRQYKNAKVVDVTKGLSTKNMIVMEVMENQLIVGTEKGLYRYNNENWVKMKILNQIDMSNQTVHLLKLLPNGQLWSVLYDETDYYRFNTGYFTMSDDYNLIWHKTPFQNLVNELFNDFEMDENGNVWAGGNKYMAIYKNDSIHMENPKLLISDVTISDTMSIGYSAINNFHRFFKKIPYEMNHISFDFTTLNFQAEDKVKFSYKLDGNMNNWSDWSTDKHIDFHNLREGKYQFKLKAQDVYDNLSDIVTFDFKIRPPWYRTITAYIGYFVLLLFGVYVAIRLANKRIQIRNEKLEKIVVDRTSEIKEQKEKLEISYEQLNEAHEDIEQSINYAERLQQGILPPLDLVEKWLPNSFIFFRPKDVVSGDFYWVEEFNNIIYFAAADCTGHGIPGAMVSMICSAALNKSLYEDEIYEPAIILDQTRQLVEDRFVRAKDKIKDGMDISLCSLDKEKGVLKWAGANNPLWILRKGSEEVEVISPNKQPIGYVENPEPFTPHEIQLNKGDSVYVFSDGFQDQFGGEKGKKYMRGKMRKFVVSLSNEKMNHQLKSFAKEFDQWKGNFDQVDDICVIGVEV